MITFGKRMALLRKERSLSQTKLAKLLNTSISVISRYEREEMTPSIDTAKKLAEVLDTTVGYLLNETDDAHLFKDPDMLRRFKDISSFPLKEKEHILFALDSMIKSVKITSL